MHITRNNCDVFQAITILKLLQIYLKTCYQQFCTIGPSGDTAWAKGGGAASPTRENAVVVLGCFFFINLLIFYVWVLEGDYMVVYRPRTSVTKGNKFLTSYIDTAICQRHELQWR